MPNRKIPEPFREMYGREAYAVYDYIGMDVSSIEGDDGKPIKFNKRDWVEMIRDANRILTSAERELSNCRSRKVPDPQRLQELQHFVDWLKINEYNPDYSQDMNRIVRELL